MSTLYNTPIPGPDGNHYGKLGPILASGSDCEMNDLWFDLVGLIPRVLAANGGSLWWFGLQQELIGDQGEQPFDPRDIPMALRYLDAFAEAIRTLRRSGIVEYTWDKSNIGGPLMFVRLVDHHE